MQECCCGCAAELLGVYVPEATGVRPDGRGTLGSLLQIGRVGPATTEVVVPSRLGDDSQGSTLTDSRPNAPKRPEGRDKLSFEGPLRVSPAVRPMVFAS